MLSRSTILHLRIPFSLYLMPVFCFALSLGSLPDYGVLAISFVAIHLFLYPASNGFNSYYDKDEESIGGLEVPPPVSNELLYVSLIFDALALCLGMLISWQFVLMLFVYGLVSKAYSHDAIRLKKFPILSLLTAALFQGAFTYVMTCIALRGLDFADIANSRILFPAGISSMMILGFYPMTQIYQHNEDARRGDYTFSRMLGLEGTFIFSAVAFALANVGFFIYFSLFGDLFNFFLLQGFLLPVFWYFLGWFAKVRKNKYHADFKHTMRLNRIASLALIFYFLTLVLRGSFL